MEKSAIQPPAMGKAKESMRMLQDVLKTIGEADGDIARASSLVYAGPKKIALYVIAIGLDTIKSKQRRTNRRAIKREVGISQRDFRQGRVTGSIVLTKQAQERVREHTERLFGPEGWMIGDLNIGQFDRAMLLAQAEREEASAKGSVVNARLYRAFAEPLRSDGQTVQDYWQPADFMRTKKRVQHQSEKLRPALVS